MIAIAFRRDVEPGAELIPASDMAFSSDARVIGVISLAHSTSHFFQLALPPLFPLLKAEFGVSYALLGSLIGVFYAALRLVGFFGLGVLGLVIGFIAVRMDLERDGASSDPSALAEQYKARERMSRAERAEYRAGQAFRLRPLFIAQVVATGFVILGFGFHFLL